MDNILRNDILKDRSFQAVVEKLESHIEELAQASKEADEAKLLRLYQGEIATCQTIISAISKIKLFYLKLHKLES